MLRGRPTSLAKEGGKQCRRLWGAGFGEAARMIMGSWSLGFLLCVWVCAERPMPYSFRS